jgi:hypothetical protein
VKRTTLARSLLIATLAFAVAFYALGGGLKPGYSHLSSFVSELNATGTPWANALSFAGFLPLALLLAAFLLAAGPLVDVRGASRLGYLLLWSQPIAFLGAVVAPCDPGCPAVGSPTQALHNLIGLVTYLAAGLAFVLLSFAPGLTGRAGVWRHLLRAAGGVWFLLFGLMLQPPLAPWRGLLQRGADGLLAAVLVFVAWQRIPGSRGRRSARAGGPYPCPPKELANEQARNLRSDDAPVRDYRGGVGSSRPAPS